MPSGVYPRRLHQGFQQGHKLSPMRVSRESRKKMSQTHRKIGSPWLIGKKHNQETRMKIRKTKLGERNPNWKGGVTPKNKLIRDSAEYALWRTAIFERDKWTCVWCGSRGTKLNADHIKPFALYPELRFAIDNGRTLCVPCHKTTESYMRNMKSRK